MSLYELIKEDFSVPKKNDPALHSSIELLFNYPGVWAIVNYRIAHKLYLKGFKRLSRILSGLSQFFTNIDIHPCATIGRRVFIDHGFGVVIGETTIIKDDVLIYQGVTLGGVSLKKGKRHPTIEENCIIGAGSKILGNITIGANSKIGANSVVIKDVDSNSTAAGVPARVIKRNQNEFQNQLDHNNIPDVPKEMISYLMKRLSVVEEALKIQDGIDLSVQEQQLEKDYEEFIDSVLKSNNSSK